LGVMSPWSYGGAAHMVPRAGKKLVFLKKIEV